MNKLLEKIHSYLEKEVKLNKKTIEEFDKHSVYIAMEIALYAHRGQIRENGEEYVHHPISCLNLYRNLVGIKQGDPFCIDVNLMYEYGVPYDGVQEVCLLHDVLEDTNISIEEIKEIYNELELGRHFEMYIYKPLQLITHDKDVPYPEYINIVMKHPTSALVKMLDLVDNSNLMTLSTLDAKKLDRSINYMKYIKVINDKYHFVEHINEYMTKMR